jgi:hypothetical protein
MQCLGAPWAYRYGQLLSGAVTARRLMGRMNGLRQLPRLTRRPNVRNGWAKNLLELNASRDKNEGSRAYLAAETPVEEDR